MAVYLHVRGDGDFAAMGFEANCNPQEVYEEMVAEGKPTKDVLIDSETDEHATVVIRQFGEVDRMFETFVLDRLVDYDFLKDETLIRVKEEIA